MRQLLVHVPRGHGDRVLEIARSHDAINALLFETRDLDDELDAAFVHVSNARVGGFIEELQSIPNLHLTLIPRGVITLHPPADQAPDQVTDVTVRSPIEIFLAGLQSVGSWRGFLGYALAAGIVVWIGLFTNTVYLLTASMLIAPFAGPAMNTAIATARGDLMLLGRGLLRYVAALLVTIVAAGLLTLIFQQDIATPLMVATSQVSSVAVLLPLVAGAAGALNLVQSQRSSLVSGAAVGLLVAASLAPPAGIIGMAAAMGEWGMVQSGGFVLVLQLVGINVSGALVFRAFGLSSQGPRYNRGQRWVVLSSAAVTLGMLAALLTWQFWDTPSLQRSSRSQRAADEIQQAVSQSGLAQLVEANVRFTRSNITGQNSLLSVVYVQRRDEIDLDAAEIRARLTRAIQQRLLQQGFNVTPLVDVSVLEAPSATE